MKLPSSLRAFLGRISILLVPTAIILFVVALGTFVYIRGRAIMEQQLRSHLESTASIAVLGIDAALVEQIRTPADIDTEAYRIVTETVWQIRERDPSILFAYIMRRTDDPNVLEFVADADTLLSFEELDRDGSGEIDEDEETVLPGDPYDVSEDAMKTLRVDAFDGPAVDEEITSDQWGNVISGYAPIKDADGNVVAVLGLDMNADQFLGIAQSIFSPVTFLLVMIAASLFAFFVYDGIQRRRLGSLRELEIERTALLDLATHQLGMPLATFRWWLEILRDRQEGAPSAEDREAFDQLQLGVDRMDHIVRSLQDAATLQTGAVKYHGEPVDPLAFVHQVVESMQPAFGLKHQRVDVTTEPSLPQVVIDPKLFSGVLGELLENARGYSPAESVIVVSLAHERSMVRIEVTDRGCGIPARDVPNIFQKFTRAGNAYTNKPVGNGLGLYICKQIVERGGGRIAIRSTEGKGTTVSIFLPIAA